MEAHEKIHKSKKDILINNFIGGIGWGLGATVGVTILLAILGLIVSKVNLVPVVGSFVADVIKFILQNNPQLIK